MAQRTGGLIVEVVPIDQPGQYKLWVRNVGPTYLTALEAATVLRQAADQLLTEPWSPYSDATP